VELKEDKCSVRSHAWTDWLMTISIWDVPTMCGSDGP